MTSSSESIAAVRHSTDMKALGERMHRFIAPLFPLCRSITGDGLRETLRRISDTLPLAVSEIPSGTPVFDWEIPREWTIRDAWIKDPTGRKIVDFAQLNLHVVGYSVPVRAHFSLDELRQHVHSLPDQPNVVPYRTSYYGDNWGFCISHRQLEGLAPGEYEVCIDSTLAPGALSYGECLIPGRSTDEVLISTHVCHPSLANDNLSGIAVAAFLGEALKPLALRYSYRFLFIPGTIGAVAWLAGNEQEASRIRHGLVAACLGDSGHLHYKRSRRHNAEIDRAAIHVLTNSGEPYEVFDFVPYGYDERQFCSPGFDLPVGSLTRTPHGRFPEYHNSSDDLRFVQPDSLADSWANYLAIIEVLEGNLRYQNLNPKCEPQLGRRGLYRTFGGGNIGRDTELALLWVLNLSDSEHHLLDIAERSKMPFAVIRRAADALVEAGLLAEVA